MKYDKVIFLCTSNTFLSPLAEGIYRKKASSLMPEPVSRGLVVLFQEPISPKVNRLLADHGFELSNHSQSIALSEEDITENTLILTMTFPEKVKAMEEFKGTEYMYTLGEFAGLDIDVSDPYGADEEMYKKCYEEIHERIDLIIKKMEDERK